MAAPRKCPDELRERATRMAVEARHDPATKIRALFRIAQQLGLTPETLRNWVRQAEVDEGYCPGTTTDDAQRIAELERGTVSCAKPTRSSKQPRLFSPQRSSTASSSEHRSGRRLH
jgi:transposase